MRRPLSSAVHDTGGAIFVETLIAYVPVLWFFLVLWQLCELMAADLVVRRAASAAARAASVVLPDDPQFYEGTSKKADVQRAAELIVKAAPQLSGVELVNLETPEPTAPTITVTVAAQFKCAGGWLAIICGGSSRRLERSATYAYHGATYKY